MNALRAHPYDDAPVHNGVVAAVAEASRPSTIRCELGLDAVANPVRIPPLNRAHGDSVQQHGGVEVVNGPGRSGLAAYQAYQPTGYGARLIVL
jgi:hypothetical protein